MKLRVYRSLYWANQGLIHAARTLEELSKDPDLPQAQLQEMRATIEETRATMNSALAERIDQHETDRAGRLDLERYLREKVGSPEGKRQAGKSEG